MQLLEGVQLLTCRWMHRQAGRPYSPGLQSRLQGCLEHAAVYATLCGHKYRLAPQAAGSARAHCFPPAAPARTAQAAQRIWQDHGAAGFFRGNLVDGG